jgi:hypothetical protein
VTGNVNELECLLSAGDKIVSTSRVQSANCEIFIVSTCEPCSTAYSGMSLFARSVKGK